MKFQEAMKRLFLAIALICLILSIDAPVSFAASSNEVNTDLVTRIDKIKAKMQTLRFCHNGSCFYREISSKILPPTSKNGNYNAVVSAIIDRPSASPDKADYHFELIDDRWALKKGEEYTDVADYMFNGDRYEIFSVHNNRNLHGDIAKARIDGNLKSGYISLYFEVLDKGIETK
jgi:hypothetical protein